MKGGRGDIINEQPSQDNAWIVSRRDALPSVLKSEVNYDIAENVRHITSGKNMFDKYGREKLLVFTSHGYILSLIGEKVSFIRRIILQTDVSSFNFKQNARRS